MYWKNPEFPILEDAPKLPFTQAILTNIEYIDMEKARRFIYTVCGEMKHPKTFWYFDMARILQL